MTTLVLADERCTYLGLVAGTLPHPHAKKGGGPAGGMLVFFEHLGFRGMSTRGVMMFSRWPCWISTSANWSSRRNEGADVRKHPSFHVPYVTNTVIESQSNSTWLFQSTKD